MLEGKRLMAVLSTIDFQGFMKRQEDDPQDAKDVFRDKLLTSDNVIPKRRLPVGSGNER